MILPAWLTFYSGFEYPLKWCTYSAVWLLHGIFVWLLHGIFYLNNACGMSSYCALLDWFFLYIHVNFISLLFVIRVRHPRFPSNEIKKYMTWHTPALPPPAPPPLTTTLTCTSIRAMRLGSRRKLEGLRSLTSSPRVLHRTSISNLRFSFSSCSWCSSARTFMMAIVQGLGTQNTCSSNPIKLCGSQLSVTVTEDNNSSGHFYGAVFHQQWWAHTALWDEQ